MNSQIYTDLMCLQSIIVLIFIDALVVAPSLASGNHSNFLLSPLDMTLVALSSYLAISYDQIFQIHLVHLLESAISP